MYLLDVNVLIALCDKQHEHHQIAWQWFSTHSRASGWATCPITENGVLRILSLKNYPHRISVADGALLLNALKSAGGHDFRTDSPSPADPHLFRHDLIRTDDTTDAYLLALAVHNRGMLATFDRRISPESVVGGEAALYLIPT